MAISIGPTCESRASTGMIDNTFVLHDGVCTTAGVIDYLCVWQNDPGDAGPVDVAIFQDEGSNTFSNDQGTNYHTGDLATADGQNEWDAGLGDFTALDVAVGDKIGCWTSANIMRAVGGNSGIANDFGDEIPASSKVFAGSDADDTYSIYGTGVESGGGIAMPIIQQHFRRRRLG